MKNMILSFLFAGVGIFCVLSSGCKNTPNVTEEPVTRDTSGHVIAMKPNIYLYPEKTCSLSVKIGFPLGGEVIKSIPHYTVEWNIEVEPSGRINNEYDYLFYESSNPDVFQYRSGWIVEKDSLLSFFERNLIKTGFSEREKNDFNDYWIPRLVDYPYYIVYPQYAKDIELAITLNFSVKPDNVLRLFYVIKGTTNNSITLGTPVIPAFNRQGFVAAEWGVILK